MLINQFGIPQEYKFNQNCIGQLLFPTYSVPGTPYPLTASDIQVFAVLQDPLGNITKQLGSVTSTNWIFQYTTISTDFYMPGIWLVTGQVVSLLTPINRIYVPQYQVEIIFAG
jgi:hypothetical protein